MIEVIPASREQQPVVANLLELYAHDFSEFHPIDLLDDGRFGYDKLPLYWTDPNRHPFLVKIDGALAGFAMVHGIDSGWDMAEFFVVRRYRKRGAGTEIAHRVWSRFPGHWEVRVMEANVTAYRFWARAIATFTGEAIRSVPVEHHGTMWRLFAFDVRNDELRSPEAGPPDPA